MDQQMMMQPIGAAELTAVEGGYFPDPAIKWRNYLWQLLQIHYLP